MAANVKEFAANKKRGKTQRDIPANPASPTIDIISSLDVKRAPIVIIGAFFVFFCINSVKRFSFLPCHGTAPSGITFKSEGAPFTCSAAGEILFMYCNKAMFDAAGLEYPSAIEPISRGEFVEPAKPLTI